MFVRETPALFGLGSLSLAVCKMYSSLIYRPNKVCESIPFYMAW